LNNALVEAELVVEAIADNAAEGKWQRHTGSADGKRDTPVRHKHLDVDFESYEEEEQN
jgi:hypothetical protein